MQKRGEISPLFLSINIYDKKIILPLFSTIANTWNNLFL